MINKLKKFFDYNAKTVQNAVLKYEIIRLKEDNERKDKSIDEWKLAFDSQEKRVKTFKEAYKKVLNEKEDLIQICKDKDSEIKKLRREVKRYEQAKIVFENK